MTKHIGIVGAGIIGSCCAAELATKGYKVTIFDRALPGSSGASRGNASHIAAPEVTPLASPGILFNALSMMQGDYAPLKVPPAQWLRLSPWLFKFLLNSRQSTHQNHVKHLGNINRCVWDDTRDLYKRARMSHFLNEAGALYLYESQDSYQNSQHHFDLFQQEGFKVDDLSRADMTDLEPDLAPIFHRGYYLPQWGTVKNPHKALLGMLDCAYEYGTKFFCETINDIQSSGSQTTVNTLNGTQYSFDQVIVTAGIWSKHITQSLKDTPLLEAERGYNLTYQQPGIEIKHPIIFGDRGIVATQLDEGLRVGGWTELGGIKAPANKDYFKHINKLAQQLFIGLQTEDHYRWMGHRPSTPSSTPVIRHCKQNQQVVYAFGHGHLGLTQAATTARLVRELME